ncbi:MAG: mercuric reductase [Spirochaetes bacterium]|nr:mercuric reductase [Spirochaetota bacterium]
MKKYDYILIGTGQATGTIIPQLLDMKKTIAIIERDRVGGLCVNYGCTPTKTLVSSAYAARMIERSDFYGIEVGNVQVNFNKVRERMNHIRNGNSKGFEEWLKSITDFYKGTGFFIDDHIVSTGNEKIYGETILIHTGTKSYIPSFTGVQEIDWLDNQSILELNELPQHLIVIGGSYIALEFAQIFKRLGSSVSIIQRNRQLLSKEDQDIAEFVKSSLEEEGIKVFCNTEILNFSKKDNHSLVEFNHNGNKKVLKGSHIFFALGRTPNTNELNLSAARVKTDKKGFILVNDHLQTSTQHIYALGDVNGRGAFTHTSVHDGQIFTDNLKGGNLNLTMRTPVSAMFIDPPLARVGINEKEAEKHPDGVLIATRRMNQISRAIEKGETTGLIKILVDKKTKKILGSTIYGTGGDEIINMLALCIQTGLTYEQIQNTVFAHPTISELIPWIFQDLKPLVDS